MNNSETNETPHKPLFNSILSILSVLILVFITSKNPLLGLIIIIVSAVLIMAYIQEDDPENYVTVIKQHN